MRLTHEHNVEVHSEVIIVGYNSETADMDNPDGAIHRIVWFVVIVDLEGHRLRHNYNFHTEHSASELAKKVRKFGEIHDRFWSVTRPVYGSPAYEENLENELSLEKEDLS